MHAPPGIFDPLRDRDPVQVGGYRLRARLGSGGMGEVFLSFDRSAVPVAVKVLRGELADDRQFRARFAQEVRSARRVRGKGIAPLVDADADAENPWLATEYIAGPTLADAVELYGPLPVSSVLVLMAGIAGALKAIHASGIVHRDLKPPNVVLGADGLRVIDFGIARAADATPLTLTGMLVGSPQYVAPEQALGLPPAPGGDIFSLGALAHYAATGRPAYGEGPRIGVLYRIVNERPDLAGCPRQIRSLIDSCLAREPADRPTTDEIVELCTPDDPPRTASDWLPTPVVFAIDAYRAALGDIAQNEAWADTVARSDAAAQTAAPEAAAVANAAADADADARTPVEAIAPAIAPRDPHDVRDNVASTGGAPTTPGRDTAATPDGRFAAPADPDVVLVGSGAASVPGPRRRVQRGAWGVAATVAVLAAGVALAVNLPSSSAAPGSVAAFGDTAPTTWPTPQAAATHATSSPVPTNAQSGQNSPLGFGPPVIPGLGPPPGPPPSGSLPGGPPPGPPPNGSGGPPPPPTVLWWSGTVRFDSEGLWLDATPPITAGGHGDIRQASSASPGEVSSGAPQIKNLAVWTGSGTPTGAQCQSLALTRGTWQTHVSVGDTVCVLTAYRQVAVLRIESLPTGNSGFSASAAVWGTTPH